MPIWVWFFFAAFASTAFTVVLAFYLDFRRMNLVQLGLLPKKTPEIFGFSYGPMSFGMGIDIPYIFSRELARSPDPATRRWTPWLRGGFCLGAAMMLAFLVSAFVLG
jgi:hypothetical protein